MSEPTFLDMPAREQLISAVCTLRPDLMRSKRKMHREAWATIELYVAMSLKVMDKTPFSEIRSHAINGEIKARLDGRQG